MHKSPISSLLVALAFLGCLPSCANSTLDSQTRSSLATGQVSLADLKVLNILWEGMNENSNCLKALKERWSGLHTEDGAQSSNKLEPDLEVLLNFEKSKDTQKRFGAVNDLHAEGPAVGLSLQKEKEEEVITGLSSCAVRLSSDWQKYRELSSVSEPIAKKQKKALRTLRTKLIHDCGRRHFLDAEKAAVGG